MGLLSGSPAIDGGFNGAIQTILATNIDSNATGFAVSNASVIAKNSLIRVDGEVMRVTDISVNTLTVQRGVNGTIAATHSQLATVSLAADQRGKSRFRGSVVDIGAFESSPPTYYVVTGTGDGIGSITTTGHTGTSADPYLATTLRAAIAAATADLAVDTIVFDPSLTASGPATISLSTVVDTFAGPSNFDIRTNITIQGPTGNYGITLLNVGSGRLFGVSADGSLTLDSLTLSGGQAQTGDSGGAVFNRGTLSIRNSTFTDIHRQHGLDG